MKVTAQRPAHHLLHDSLARARTELLQLHVSFAQLLLERAHLIVARALEHLGHLSQRRLRFGLGQPQTLLHLLFHVLLPQVALRRLPLSPMPLHVERSVQAVGERVQPEGELVRLGVGIRPASDAATARLALVQRRTEPVDMVCESSEPKVEIGISGDLERRRQRRARPRGWRRGRLREHTWLWAGRRLRDGRRSHIRQREHPRKPGGLHTQDVAQLTLEILKLRLDGRGSARRGQAWRGRRTLDGGDEGALETLEPPGNVTLLSLVHLLRQPLLVLLHAGHALGRDRVHGAAARAAAVLQVHLLLERTQGILAPFGRLSQLALERCDAPPRRFRAAVSVVVVVVVVTAATTRGTRRARRQAAQPALLLLLVLPMSQPLLVELLLELGARLLRIRRASERRLECRLGLRLRRGDGRLQLGLHTRLEPLALEPLRLRDGRVPRVEAIGERAVPNAPR